jgi:hypothetical protein
MENQIIFNGYPVVFETINGEVYVTCKGVTGSLRQIENFMKCKKSKRVKYFGESKVRQWNKGLVKIDCLEDTNEKVIEIYKHAKELKNEHGHKLGHKLEHESE